MTAGGARVGGIWFAWLVVRDRVCWRVGMAGRASVGPTTWVAGSFDRRGRMGKRYGVLARQTHACAQWRWALSGTSRMAMGGAGARRSMAFCSGKTAASHQTLIICGIAAPPRLLGGAGSGMGISAGSPSSPSSSSCVPRGISSARPCLPVPRTTGSGWA